MSHFPSSPLIRHQLSSILPYETKLYQQKQFLKTKQFYKPQQFIWNNPHRTSNNLYKFYHKYNDHYENNKAPVIKLLETHDLQQREVNRIQKLTNLRQQTRKRFFTRQKDRQTLQMLSGTKQISQRDNYNMTTASKRFSTISHYHPKPTMSEPMIQSHIPSKIPIKKQNSLVKNIQQTYLTGLGKSQAKIKKIQNLIVSETHRHQNTLRIDFQKQKQNNSKKVSRISKFDISQLELRSLCKQV